MPYGLGSGMCVLVVGVPSVLFRVVDGDRRPNSLSLKFDVLLVTVMISVRQLPQFLGAERRLSLRASAYLQ